MQTSNFAIIGLQICAKHNKIDIVFMLVWLPSRKWFLSFSLMLIWVMSKFVLQHWRVNSQPFLLLIYHKAAIEYMSILSCEDRRGRSTIEPLGLVACRSEQKMIWLTFQWFSFSCMTTDLIYVQYYWIHPYSGIVVKHYTQ